DGRLEPVEAAAPADHVVGVLRATSVVADPSHFAHYRLVTGENHSAVSERPEVLSRVEAETARIAVAADELAVPGGEMRLRFVGFHDTHELGGGRRGNVSSQVCSPVAIADEGEADRVDVARGWVRGAHE